MKREVDNTVNAFFPNLSPLPEDIDPGIVYPPPGVVSGAQEAARKLFMLRTALVKFPDNPNLNHVVEDSTPKKVEEIWDRELENQLDLHEYPMFTFPNWGLYKFWRAGQAATDEQVEQGYGYEREGWLHLTPSGADHVQEFTFFSAIRRSFGDRSDADYLEIKHPGNKFPLGRVPFDVYERMLNPSEAPSRVEQYPSLWLPKLVMDRDASQWFKNLQAERTADDLDQAA